MRALKISLDGQMTAVHLPKRGRTVAAIRGLIAAAAVEPLAVTSRWDMWVDENGRANNQPLNTYATALAQQHGVRFGLFGPVVITGPASPTGSATGLTPENITAIRQQVASLVSSAS